MPITARMPLPLLAAMTLALGCAAEDGNPLDEEAGCRDDEIHYADHCDETHCGPAEVEVGTGASDFVELDEGDSVDIVFGSQGGYHLDVSARMTRLCPIVYLRASVWLDRGDGSDLEEIFDVDRHVEAVRTEPQSSSLQEFWGVRAFVPCQHWPDTNANCSGGAGSGGHLEDFEIVLQLEAEDHTGRVAIDEQRVQPVCCEG